MELTILRDPRNSRYVVRGKYDKKVKADIGNAGFIWSGKDQSYTLATKPSKSNERTLLHKLNSANIQVKFADIVPNVRAGTKYTVYRTAKYARTLDKDGVPIGIREVLVDIGFRYVPRPGCYIYKGDESAAMEDAKAHGVLLSIIDFDVTMEPPKPPKVAKTKADKAPKTADVEPPKVKKTRAPRAAKQPTPDEVAPIKKTRAKRKKAPVPVELTPVLPEQEPAPEPAQELAPVPVPATAAPSTVVSSPAPVPVPLPVPTPPAVEPAVGEPDVGTCTLTLTIGDLTLGPLRARIDDLIFPTIPAPVMPPVEIGRETIDAIAQAVIDKMGSLEVNREERNRAILKIELRKVGRRILHSLRENTKVQSNISYFVNMIHDSLSNLD